jgi:hypothetical protein
LSYIQIRIVTGVLSKTISQKHSMNLLEEYGSDYVTMSGRKDSGGGNGSELTVYYPCSST